LLITKSNHLIALKLAAPQMSLMVNPTSVDGHGSLPFLTVVR
jgi:hypothetical protein